ncbi:MAG: hypothetical protein ACNS63_04760 [Candidatus Nitrospinota bacterium M3_3B_026]
MRRFGECRRCGECCRSVRITGVLSHVVGQHGSLEEARVYYSFRGIRITDADHGADRLLFEIDIPCERLTSDNLCALNGRPEEKPVICHRYPMFPDDIEGCGYTWR